MTLLLKLLKQADGKLPTEAVSYILTGYSRFTLLGCWKMRVAISLTLS